MDGRSDGQLLFAKAVSGGGTIPTVLMGVEVTPLLHVLNAIDLQIKGSPPSAIPKGDPQCIFKWVRMQHTFLLN